MKKIIKEIKEWSTNQDLTVTPEMIQSRTAAKDALKEYRKVEKQYKKYQEAAQAAWDEYLKKQDEFLKALNKKN